jgi:hypothetical protein
MFLSAKWLGTKAIESELGEGRPLSLNQLKTFL